MKHVTLLFLRREGQVLLAMKKRGFGINKWNGVGGKLDPGETPEQAAIRECQEEIEVTPKNIKLVGNLDFTDLPSAHHFCHVFTATEWEGNPAETEEMRPQWFAENAVPYESMWADDAIWFPIMLDNKLFKGVFTIAEDNTIKEHTIAEVDSL